MLVPNNKPRSPAAGHHAGRTVGQLIRHWAQARPDHPFLVWEPFEQPGHTWTYREFAQDCQRLAAGLTQRGVRHGDRVLIHLDNSPELLLTWYACAMIGAVGVTTNTRSAGPELAYFAEHSEAVGAVTQPSLAEALATEAPQLRWLAVLDHDAGAAPANGWEPPIGTEPFAALLLNTTPGTVSDAEIDALDPVGIQYTSGTTARPKAVVWTHANALWGGQVNARHLELTPADVTLCFLPLFHTNAQAYSVLGSLWVGGTVVLLPRFTASRFWPLSLKHRCTWTSMIPFCLKALLEHPIPESHHYRVWGNGICAPPTDELFKVTTVGWWGMTETITHGIVGDLHWPSPSMSCGRAAPEYEIAVVDDTGEPVEPGKTGHLLVRGIRGVSLFLEYLKDPQATADAFDDHGWFRTGDRVRTTPEGFIFFADRDKDMLKVGGENVAASEIEAVIRASGWAEEVAVVARRHPMLDEVPVAFVIPGPGAPSSLEAELIAHCRQHLADFKVPHAVYPVEDMPRSTLEKINKAALRATLAADA
ncbi:MAG: AMP-binding protein [Pseudomonadota bacterium]|nr:AMP-binding protein [Pseudomonadota bacterium]